MTGVTSGFTGAESCLTTHSEHYPKCYNNTIYITLHLLVLNICRDCVNLTEVPEGDWLCDQCFTTPAHLPLGGPPDNNTVPSDKGILPNWWLYIGSCMVSIHLHALCYVHFNNTLSCP